jgi:TonB-dependent starch-binding outer membrane protein SusC
MKKHRHLLNFLFLFLSLMFTVSALAQNLNITGVVTDGSNGSTMPGVTIAVKNTSSGTITDIDGKYSLNAAQGATLVFSFIGYTTQEITVGANRVINVAMQPELTELEELVVIGYGTQRKSDRTGAVVAVQADDMNKGVLTDPIQGMQGKAAGVLITKKGGDPNEGFAVRVRGASSLSTETNPLYVVDGVPGVDPTTISTEDIESFNVLKDASAAAIYGSRGAHGVVIITTKKGASRGNSIEFSSFVSTENVANRLELLDADQVRAYVQSNNLNFNDGGANTDWLDEIYRTGSSQNYSLAFNGGTSKGGYRASISHSNFTGVIIGSEKSRTIGRLNIDDKFFNERLLVSAGLAGTFEQNDYVNYSSNGPFDVIYQAIQRNPTDPVYAPDGSYYEIERDFQYGNPVALANEVTNERSAKDFFSFLRADLEIAKGLFGGVNISYVRDDNETYYFEPDYLQLGKFQGYGRRSYNNRSSKLIETTLKYITSFSKNNLELLGGYSWQDEVFTGLFAQGASPFINYPGPNDLGQLQTVNAGRDIGSYNNNSILISFFARSVYNFDNKYFLTATIRRDGSSKFGVNKEWGWFPSASAMWNITGEDFMSGIDFINNLRLRVGYGLAGNEKIGIGRDRRTYVSGGTAVNFETGEDVILMFFSDESNPNLQWETNRELNLGLDFGFANDMISGTFEYFNKTNYDLLGRYDIPQPPNLSGNIWANVGEIEIKGWEATVQAYPVKTAKFSWKTNITYSTYEQTVVNLSDSEMDLNWSADKEGYISGRGLVGDLNWTQVIKPGYSVGTWYIPEYAGISDDGKFLFYTASGGVTREASKAERRYMGDANPDFELGWSNSFTFLKNFDFNFTIRAVYGHEIFNTTRLFFGNPYLLPNLNVLESALEEEDRGLNDNPKMSSYYLEDGSFARLDNLSLGYNIPLKKVKALRVYVAANNVFTLTNYTGVDPEISAIGRSFGLDQYNVYPKTRTILLGVNVTL